MNYYGRNDIPLGEFLHRYCFRSAYVCQSCDIDMDKHQRHFVHGVQEIRISMQKLATTIPGGDKNIFTWSTCSKCAFVSFRVNIFCFNFLIRVLRCYLCLKRHSFFRLPNFWNSSFMALNILHTTFKMRDSWKMMKRKYVIIHSTLVTFSIFAMERKLPFLSKLQ